jgi:hypothetical protein
MICIQCGDTIDNKRIPMGVCSVCRSNFCYEPEQHKREWQLVPEGTFGIYIVGGRCKRCKQKAN